MGRGEGIGGSEHAEPGDQAAVHTLRLFPRGRAFLLCRSHTRRCTQKREREREKEINIKAMRDIGPRGRVKEPECGRGLRGGV